MTISQTIGREIPAQATAQRRLPGRTSLAQEHVLGAVLRGGRGGYLCAPGKARQRVLPNAGARTNGTKF